MVTMTFTAESMSELIQQIEAAANSFRKPKGVEALRRQFQEIKNRRFRVTNEQKLAIEAGLTTEEEIISKELGLNSNPEPEEAQPEVESCEIYSTF